MFCSLSSIASDVLPNSPTQTSCYQQSLCRNRESERNGFEDIVKRALPTSLIMEQSDNNCAWQVIWLVPAPSSGKGSSNLKFGLSLPSPSTQLWFGVPNHNMLEMWNLYENRANTITFLKLFRKLHLNFAS